MCCIDYSSNRLENRVRTLYPWNAGEILREDSETFCIPVLNGRKGWVGFVFVIIEALSMFSEYWLETHVYNKSCSVLCPFPVPMQQYLPDRALNLARRLCLVPRFRACRYTLLVDYGPA